MNMICHLGDLKEFNMYRFDKLLSTRCPFFNTLGTRTVRMAAMSIA